MNNRVYKYFFYEFFSYFIVVLFAISAIIWTIQAVNFLDLVTEDGHAFKVYFFYSILILPKVITKLIPITFLIALIITITKMDKDNELIVLWTSGLNKINLVNLIFRISLIIAVLQIIFACVISPETLNYSRNLIKNSQLDFIPSLLKERRFNDTVKDLTIFVNKKNSDGSFDHIFIEDNGNVLTKVANVNLKETSVIFAKSGYIADDDKNLFLFNGSIQKRNNLGKVSVIKFEKTIINLSKLTTKTATAPKIQETSTFDLIMCLSKNISELQNCNLSNQYQKNLKIEINKRFGTAFYIPTIALIICFLLSSRKDKKIYTYNKYIFGFISFAILTGAEITVRYSGNSLNHSLTYYLTPIILLPITYLLLLRTFKYENLN